MRSTEVHMTGVRLETRQLCKRFGGVVALDRVNVEFVEGSITAVIGPNGAGKTTLFSVIMGLQHADSGDVILSEMNGAGTPVRTLKLGGLPTYQIAANGVSTMFQDVRVFRNMSALDNVAVGVPRQGRERPFGAAFRVRGQDETRLMARAAELLEYVGLESESGVLAGQLSFGQQKLVALARLLAFGAPVLLVDEATAGVQASMVGRLLKLLRRLAYEQRKTIVLIEHNLNVVREIGDWVYLMASGRVEAFGEPAELLSDRKLFEQFPTL